MHGPTNDVRAAREVEHPLRDEARALNGTPHAGVLFHDENVVASRGEVMRHRRAGGARADDERVDPLHGVGSSAR